MHTTPQFPLSRRAWLTAACATAVAILGLPFSTAQAQAGTGYAFATSFDIGQAVGAVAVDTSTNSSDPSKGDVYVTDGTVVKKFTAAQAAEGSSTPTAQLAGGLGSIDALAVDPANGDLYVAENPEYIRKFGPEGKELPFSLRGVSLNNPIYALAVDPANSDLYVAEGEANFTINQYTSSGEYTGQQYLSEATGANAEEIAVDSSGNVYVAQANLKAHAFESSCPSPCSTYRTLDSDISDGVTIDPATGNVFVDQESFETEERSLVELEPDGSQVGHPFGLAQFISPNNFAGVALNGSGSALYVVTLPGHEVDLFTAGPTPAEPVKVEATGVTSTTAMLEGELAGEETGYYFAYNIGPSCGGGLTTAPGKASGSVKESAEVTGLQPDVHYTFCLVATNKYGQTEGSKGFETPPAPPSVDGESASSVTQTAATLEAQVNPNNEETTCVAFEYGETTSYGSSVPCEQVELGSVYGDQRVTAKIKGLTDATTYHFRVVVSNATSSGGETDGPDAEFKTHQPAPAVTTGADLAVTQTTATITGTVDPEILSTVYFYDYGLSTAYGAATSRIPAGEGATPATATEFLGSLVPGTTYHYRLVAINEDGTSYGEDRQFTTLAYTPPGVVTGGASAGSPNAATLSGTVDPQGIPTTYEFQVGTDTNYGARIYAAAGESDEPQAEALPIAGLQPGTTYHFRICATNEANASDPVCGADATFTTLMVPSALVQPGTLPFLTIPAVVFPTETGNTQSPSIIVVGHSVKGHTASIRLSVPSAGKLVATGKDVSKGTAKATKAGDVTVRLTLTKAERARLAKHRGRRLLVDVKLVFTPTRGAELTTTTAVLIG